MKTAYIVTGLGYGDEGKGTITHWLARERNAHTVIRTGGPQALHRVVTSGGRSHVFSQFGSGTLEGVRTHLSRDMLIDPYAILREGEALEKENGVRGVFDFMTIDRDALVITPFHAIAGRLRELLRGPKRYGSVGIGVGETILDAEAFPDEAVRAKDLATTCLLEKLIAIQRRKCEEFAHVVGGTVSQEALLELEELRSDETVRWAMLHFREFAQRIRVVDQEYVASRIFSREGSLIVEGSQGVLLDRCHGFHPYTTKVRTVPSVARRLLEQGRYQGSIESFGVLRAYHTRHGAGPFVAESAKLTEALPDLTNQTHRWQGSFRVGMFDAVMARYAIDVCRDNGGIDGLVMTCLDRIAPMARWEYCHAYRSPEQRVAGLEGTAGMITRITPGRLLTHDRQIERQSRIADVLARCKPTTYSAMFEKGDDAALVRRIIPLVANELKVPLVAVSAGETELGKRWL